MKTNDAYDDFLKKVHSPLIEKITIESSKKDIDIKKLMRLSRKRKPKIKKEDLYLECNISKVKRIKYTATRKEWLRCLTYYTDPDIFPPCKFLKGTNRSISFRGVTFKGHHVFYSTYYLANLVQKSILQHNWPVAVNLLQILLKRNLNSHQLRFLTESIFAVVQSHPSSNPKLIEQFSSATAAILYAKPK